MLTKFRVTLVAGLSAVLLLGYGLLSQQSFAIQNALYTLASLAILMFLDKKTDFFTDCLYRSTTVFLLLSLLVGGGLQFYAVVPYWDKALHFLSGFLAFSLGKRLYDRHKMPHNQRLSGLFSLCFAVSIAAVWEFYEFSLDGFFGMSAQNGSLSDTMWDMLAGSISAFLAFLCERCRNTLKK